MPNPQRASLQLIRLAGHAHRRELATECRVQILGVLRRNERLMAIPELDPLPHALLKPSLRRETAFTQEGA